MIIAPVIKANSVDVPFFVNPRIDWNLEQSSRRIETFARMNIDSGILMIWAEVDCKSVNIASK
jgi:hypothetical protein